MSSEPSITVLHLSDMQFGPHHRFESDGELGSLLARLEQDLRKLEEREGLRPDLCVLSGDLTEHGMKSQFESALSFAHGVASVLGVSSRRVVMVPGNHDINRKAAEAYFAGCAADELEPREPYYPKYRHYADFFSRFYEGEPGISFNEAEPWSFFEYPDLKLVVAGLNSTISESHLREHHYGFLGEVQLRALAEKLRPYKERGFLRIGAVHHDLLHPPADNERARQDLKDIRQMLAPWVNVLLHGHTHEEELEWLDGGVPVFCIGSAGVNPGKRPEEVPNQYQILRIFADRVEYGTRAYQPDKKRWVGCVRADLEGEAWKLEKKVSFERVEGTFSAAVRAEAAPETELALVVASYRSHMAQSQRNVAFFDVAGMAEDMGIEGGIERLRIFVPQKVRREALPLDALIERGGFLPEDADLVFARRDEEREREREHEILRAQMLMSEGPPRPVDELLLGAAEPWVFVTGAPGAGKSELTRWLSLKLCVSGEAMGELSPDLVPVRVEMRRFDLCYQRAKESGRFYDFFAYLDEVLGEKHLRLRGELLIRLAEAGRLVWLFDGLDEVADPHARRDYAEMIVGLSRRYGGRGLVTSRLVGARPVQPLFHHAGFGCYTLLDFDAKQIDDFLDHWHELAFPGAPEAGLNRRKRLQATLEGSRAVRDLCSNPLLLTLIALLNRGGELPRRRHLLYERAVELMASQWEANKGLSRTAASRFDLPDKKRFLRRLAWRMMTEWAGGSGNLVRQGDLLDFAVGFCQEQYGEGLDEAKQTASLLIQHLRERNHILTLLGGQVFGFVHKSFLEYLAAAEVHTRFRRQEWDVWRIGEIFVAHWEDQAWEETLTLICGMLEEDRPAYVVEILQSVLASVGPLDGLRISHFNAFAVRCLAEIGQLGQEPVRSFALAVTDAIREYYDRDFFFPLEKLSLALRMCDGSWPGAEPFKAWAREACTDKALNHRLKQVPVICAITSNDRCRRVALLLDLLKVEMSPVLWSTMIRESAKLGPWTAEEIESLMRSVRNEPDRIQVPVLVPLVEAGVPSLDELLARFMGDASATNPLHRIQAAGALLGRAEYRTHALDVLMAFVEGSDYVLRHMALNSLIPEAEKDFVVRERVLSLLSISRKELGFEVARLLAPIWHGEEVVRFLEGGLDSPEWWYIAIKSLVALAPSVPAVRGILKERVRRGGDGSVKFYSAMALAEFDDPAATGYLVECLSERSSLPLVDENRVEGAAILLQMQMPAYRSLGFNVLVEYASAARNDWSARFARDIIIVLAKSNSVARAVLAKLATNDDEQVRVEALKGQIHISQGDDPSARDKLFMLATTAKSEHVRLEAARALVDREILTHLAEHAKEDKIGKEAALDLRRLRAYEAALRVGKKRRGRVSLDGRFVGWIEETTHGSRFVYDPAYMTQPDAYPLAPNMPFRVEPYESLGLHPFFENLLPEGWLLDRTCEKLGIDRTDAFGLLLATCADCAGAVEVFPADLAA